MQRPTSYKTLQGEAVLAYLASVSDVFVTAAQVKDHLESMQVPVSRATVYRQLERLASSGRVRKHLFDGVSVTCYQYVGDEEPKNDSYHLICEVCEGVFDLECDELDFLSEHVLADHAFQINEGKTVFYGRCRTCLKK